MITKQKLAKYIDHTILKPETTFEDIDKLCDEAIKYGFYSVCVNSCFIEYVARKLSESDVKIGTTVGFPLGANCKKGKAFEAKEAVKKGAHEIDMVMNIGFLKTGDYYKVQEDIEEVVKATKEINPETIVKVIIETCLLTENEKVSACQIAKNAGADFVKTSTGFNKGGATYSDVKLMKKLVGDKMQVKAAGGIRDLKTALSMIEAGATRIGSSSGIKILKEIDN